jgi:phosphoglycolate phosphatase
LDGTLLDTLKDLADAMNQALRGRGYEAAHYDEYRRRVGWGLHEMVRRSLPEDDRTDESIVEAIASEFRGIHFDRPVVKTVPFPGVIELIQDLIRFDIPLFVHTNKPDAIARTVVDIALISQIDGIDTAIFRGILGQRDDIPRKPDPTGVFRLLEEAGLPLDGCWYIGDSEIDIDTARGAGCTAVGVTWGFRDRDAIAAAEADYICYSVDELREVIGLVKSS